MRELTALIKQYKGRSESMFRIASATVAGKTSDRTPVLTGSLRASWTPNNGQPITRNVNIGLGGSGRNNISQVVNTLKTGDTFSFANGQPYAREIEYEGKSRKAPNGMRDVSVAEWESIVASAVKQAGG